MADASITLPGTGTLVDTRTIGSEHRQVLVIGDPANVAGVAPVDATNGLTVTMAATSPGIIATGTQAAPAAQYLSTVAAGDIPHGTTDSGNPQKIGGIARSTEIGALTAGSRVNAAFDLVGKLITLPYSNPENFVSGATTAVTSTTPTQLLGVPAAGLRNYVTQITVSNKHATIGTDVVITDGSGGAVLYVIPASAVYGGGALTFPTPLRQPSTATALYCAALVAADIRVSASGYKGA